MKTLLTAFVGSMALATAPMAMSAEANKELKMAYDADPVSLDIHEQLSGGMLQLSHMTFDPLIRWTKDLGFEPRLAKSWERIDENTMRFELREGVNFHSGNELTAKDVKFTFDRLKQSQDYKAIFKPFSELKVIDDYTFELVTNEPYPLLLNTATYIFPLDSEFYTGKTESGKDKPKAGKTRAPSPSTAILLLPRICPAQALMSLPVVSRACVSSLNASTITGIPSHRVTSARSC